ncbi:hypothetical protein ACLKA6_002032 [Drosophila palustris]
MHLRQCPVGQINHHQQQQQQQQRQCFRQGQRLAMPFLGLLLPLHRQSLLPQWLQLLRLHWPIAAQYQQHRHLLTPAAAPSLSNAKKCKPTQIVVRLKPHINQGANALFQSFQMHTPPITEYSVKLGGAGTLRILPKTPDAYQQILNVLRADNSLEYNTYQCRDDRSFRVVVLGIPASLGVSAIRDELSCMGYTVRSVYFPKYKSRSGTGVYMPNFFFLDLATSQVCHRCQRFNHTARYCLHAARCVKCGDEHDTRLCQKPDSLPPKCANCGMAHAANYRGCPVLVKLLRLKLSHNNSPSNQLRLQQSNNQRQQQLPKQQPKRPNGQQQQSKRPNGQQQQQPKRPNGQQQHQQQQPKRKQSRPPQQRQQQQATTGATTTTFSSPWWWQQRRFRCQNCFRFTASP